MVWLGVALGGALGSVARYAATEIMARRYGSEFPLGTLLVNVAGSLLVGLLAGVLLNAERPDSLPRLFLIVGFCGGFTTFSAFSLQTLELLQAGQPAKAAMNVALSIALCLLAVWAGHALAAALRKGG